MTRHPKGRTPSAPHVPTITQCHLRSQPRRSLLQSSRRAARCYGRRWLMGLGSRLANPHGDRRHGGSWGRWDVSGPLDIFSRRRTWLGFALALGALFFVGAFGIQCATRRDFRAARSVHSQTEDGAIVTAHVTQEGEIRAAGLRRVAPVDRCGNRTNRVARNDPADSCGIAAGNLHEGTRC